MKKWRGPHDSWWLWVGDLLTRGARVFLRHPCILMQQEMKWTRSHGCRQWSGLCLQPRTPKRDLTASAPSSTCECLRC